MMLGIIKVQVLFRLVFIFLVVFAALSVSGCITAQKLEATPESKVQSWSGRFSLTTDTERTQGLFEWQVLEKNMVLALKSPLGNTLAVLQTNRQSQNTFDAVMLETGGRTVYAANFEALTQQVLGAPIPVTGLAQWLQKNDVNTENYIADGWTIQRTLPEQSPQQSPRIVTVRREQPSKVDLRLVFDE